MPSRNYRDLVVWQRAMDLVEAIYKLTRSFPREEIYGMTAQMRRAAVSIPSNIAEGQGRGGVREFIQFLRIAHGSLRELETQVSLTCRLGFAPQNITDELLAQAGDVGRMLNGLMKSQQG